MVRVIAIFVGLVICQALVLAVLHDGGAREASDLDDTRGLSRRESGRSPDPWMEWTDGTIEEAG